MTEGQSARAVQPWEVVDDEQERLVDSGGSEQRQDGVRNGGAGWNVVGAEAENGGEHGGLLRGDAIEMVAQGMQDLSQPRLARGVVLDAGGLQDAASSLLRPLGCGVEQGGLAYARLPGHQQRRADFARVTNESGEDSKLAVAADGQREWNLWGGRVQVHVIPWFHGCRGARGYSGETLVREWRMNIW